jgi:hypothetical protein
MNDNTSASRLNEDAQEPVVANGPSFMTLATEDSVAEAGNQQQHEAAKQAVR